MNGKEKIGHGLDRHRRKVSEQKRASILAAGFAIVAKHGYERAPMAKIAQLADVSTATLYKHFDSKEALMVALIEDCSKRHGQAAATLFVFNSLTTGARFLPSENEVPANDALAAALNTVEGFRSALQHAISEEKEEQLFAGHAAD